MGSFIPPEKVVNVYRAMRPRRRLPELDALDRAIWVILDGLRAAAWHIGMVHPAPFARLDVGMVTHAFLSRAATIWLI
jgi:hypothetical protein